MNMPPLAFALRDNMARSLRKHALTDSDKQINPYLLVRLYPIHSKPCRTQ